MDNKPIGQTKTLKEIFIKHFIQIITGCILYFYYVGYIFSLMSIHDSFIRFIHILENPNIKEIVFLGIFGFLIFNCCLFLYLSIFEFFRFLYVASKKYIKERKELSFILAAIVVLEILFLLFSEKSFWFWIIFAVTIGSIINISNIFKKISSSLIFKYFEAILICFYLIVFPFCAMQSSIIKTSFYDPDVYVNSGLNVVTKIPLTLEEEKKIDLGYVNKLELLDIEGNIIKFLEPKEQRLVILKVEDIIRIVRDSHPLWINRGIGFEMGWDRKNIEKNR